MGEQSTVIDIVIAMPEQSEWHTTQRSTHTRRDFLYVSRDVHVMAFKIIAYAHTKLLLLCAISVRHASISSLFVFSPSLVDTRAHCCVHDHTLHETLYDVATNWAIFFSRSRSIFE